MTPSPLITTGTLRIGDQWNAINIIAQSQTHPLKAICELTENAIDAGAAHVRILRRRLKGNLQLEVHDDGRGVAVDETGVPDFQRIATHLCDSMKRHLDARHRRGVHGEFGIGLLSFWSLGDELRMISGTGPGGARELVLARGGRNYTIRPVRGRLATGGTRVVIAPLLDATKSLVTGEKIARYLSAELRDRIRTTGVTIDVIDSVARKEMRVTPREYDGDRLELPRRYPTCGGDVHVELYLRSEGSTADSGIALCKDGTRVLKEITDLLPFQHAPWNDSRLEGLIDFEPLSLAPGTRSGVVADAALAALVAVTADIQRDILAALDTREQAETERASRQILKQVHKAFVSALTELPAAEYIFFDIPKQSLAVTDHNGSRGEPLTQSPRATAGEPPEATLEPVEATPLFPTETGPLHTVGIAPRRPRRQPGTACRLTATPRDSEGSAIRGGVTFSWRVVSGAGAIEPAAATCQVMSAETGLVAVEVVALQERVETTDLVEVLFSDESASDGPGTRGLPSYRLEPEHGQFWRSRYDAAKNEIIINSAHRDFLASRSSATKHRRYIGKLYAKEVVLSNFPHETPAEAMERLIELTLRTEDTL